MQPIYIITLLPFPIIRLLPHQVHRMDLLWGCELGRSTVGVTLVSSVEEAGMCVVNEAGDCGMREGSLVAIAPEIESSSLRYYPHYY